MSDYLESLDKQADNLLKERPEEIKKLADEFDKTVEDCKKKGIDFSFDNFLRMCTKIVHDKNATHPNIF